MSFWGSHSFAAAYSGNCYYPHCDDSIQPGDEVEYVDRELMHSSCATRARHDPKLCDECFTYHRGECL